MPTNKKKKIKCDRCFDELRKESQIFPVLFMAEEEECMKNLCRECYDITLSAASPESWQGSAQYVQEKGKHWYFDKKRNIIE